VQNLPIATGYTHVTALVILIAIQTAQVLHLAILVDVLNTRGCQIAQFTTQNWKFQFFFLLFLEIPSFQSDRQKTATHQGCVAVFIVGENNTIP